MPACSDTTASRPSATISAFSSVVALSPDAARRSKSSSAARSHASGTARGLRLRRLTRRTLQPVSSDAAFANWGALSRQTRIAPSGPFFPISSVSTASSLGGTEPATFLASPTQAGSCALADMIAQRIAAAMTDRVAAVCMKASLSRLNGRFARPAVDPQSYYGDEPLRPARSTPAVPKVPTVGGKQSMSPAELGFTPAPPGSQTPSISRSLSLGHQWRPRSGYDLANEVCPSGSRYCRRRLWMSQIDRGCVKTRFEFSQWENRRDSNQRVSMQWCAVLYTAHWQGARWGNSLSPKKNAAFLHTLDP